MTTGWDAINKAAEYQQQRIMEAIGRHVSHHLLARSMDVGLARAGYDHVVRTESFDAGRAEGSKKAAARVEQLELETRLLREVLEQAKADQSMLRQYAHAADRVFQGRDSLLPDFLRLGDCKAEGIVRLAEAYLDLKQRHAVEREAHAKAAEALAGRWIPCCERMPPIGQRVLAHRPHERAEIMRWGPPPEGFGYGRDHEPVWWCMGTKGGVTHWMPLPSQTPRAAHRELTAVDRVRLENEAAARSAPLAVSATCPTCGTIISIVPSGIISVLCACGQVYPLLKAADDAANGIPEGPQG